MAIKCEAEYPELLTSTRLRKYLATVSQVKRRVPLPQILPESIQVMHWVIPLILTKYNWIWMKIQLQNPTKKLICSFFSSPELYFYAPLEKGGILLCNCRSVGMSVCQSVDQVVSSLSFDPFTWSIPNLVQRLPTMSSWIYYWF